MQTVNVADLDKGKTPGQLYSERRKRLVDAYGLRQKAVEIEGKAPTPRQFLALVKQARAEGVKIIFLQPQFDARRGQAIAEAIDGRVVIIDSLASDVIQNLDNVATYVQQSFTESSVK